LKEKEVQIEVEAHVPPTGMSPVLRDLVSVEYLTARPLLGRLLEAKLYRNRQLADDRGLNFQFNSDPVR